MIPKTHDLGFCFFPLLGFRNCLPTLDGFWSYVRSTDFRLMPSRKPCGIQKLIYWPIKPSYEDGILTKYFDNEVLVFLLKVTALRSYSKNPKGAPVKVHQRIYFKNPRRISIRAHRRMPIRAYRRMSI